jgi:hypothetical protein
MTAIYVCAHQGGQPTYHDTEQAAESRARQLVLAKTTTTAVVYRMEILEEVA